MVEPAPASDLDLILAQAGQGDAQAWASLVRRYTPRVFALLVRQCGDRDLAEEITQATFVSVVEHIGGYRDQGKFEPWLFRIAMNRLRDEMRRRKRQARSMDMSGSSGDEQTGSAWAAAEAQLSTDRDWQQSQDPAASVARAEQIDQLRRAIDQLGEADRQVLHLRHTAGLSFQEIAQTLQQPLGTVLARAHRALAKLRTLLSPAMEG
jgi:RNA polymerase sigma-70 factor (ECF subfamily)